MDRKQFRDKIRTTLGGISKLPDNWDGLGAESPNIVSIENARVFLTYLSQIGYPPDRVDASVDGGVCISFRNNDKYGDIEFFNTGEVLGIIAGQDFDTHVWQIKSTDFYSHLEVIRKHLGN